MRRVRGSRRLSTVAVRRIWAVLAAVAAVFGLAGVCPGSASAATTPGYSTALVEFQASTRTQPYLNNTYWGFALRDPSQNARQTVSVGCWWDGDWATGN